MPSFKNTVEFNGVVCVAESPKALSCVINGVRHWMPKSQIADDSEVQFDGDRGTLIVSEWIATEKGLV